MEHRILKSAALALALLAGLLIVGWAASLSNDPKTAQLAFRKTSYVCLALGKGDLILCDHFDNRGVIRLVDTRKLIHPSVAKDIRAALPGFTFWHLTLTSGQRIWSLELSLLIPAIPMALVAALFFWLLRIRPVTACSPEPPNESMQQPPFYVRASTGSRHAEFTIDAVF